MTKRAFAIHTYRRPVRLTLKGWEHETIEAVVRVLARAEGWAMVRQKHGRTTAVPEKELTPIGAAEAKAKPPGPVVKEVV